MIINWRLVQELAAKGMEVEQNLQDLAKEWQDVVSWAESNGFDEDHCKAAYKYVMAQLTRRSLHEVFVEMRRIMATGLPPLQ